VKYRYIDRNSAQKQGIIRNEGNSVYVGVDYWSYTSTGRQSVRLESKQKFMRGLFVLDIKHCPVASAVSGRPCTYMSQTRSLNSSQALANLLRTIAGLAAKTGLAMEKSP